MSTVVENLFDRYKKFVGVHPEIITQIESTIRILSYLIPARFEDATIVSELIYSSSNLLVLLNDALLRKAANVKISLPVDCEKLAHWLSVLDCVEVFLEIVADRLWGQTFRWIVITCIVIAKTAIRLVLLWKNKSGIQISPPVPPLNRDKDLKPHSINEDGEPHFPSEVGPDATTFTLKRSGRVVRTLNATPPIVQRSWKLPATGNMPEESTPVGPPTQLSNQQLIAETLHIIRPVAHLLSMYRFGLDSWKPWLIAAGIDISSLQLMGQPKKMNSEERKEVKRRTVQMLLYLMRSPFYDNYTRTKLFFLLNGLSNSVPFVRLLAKPVMEYLPYWQQMYFYVWNT